MNPEPFNEKKRIPAFHQTAKILQKTHTLNLEIIQRLLQRLDFIKISPQVIVDIGCGAGEAIHTLSHRYPNAQTIGLDRTKKHLNQAQLKHPGVYICAERDHLPFKGQSVDLAFSNLILQECSDLFRVFQSIRRILRPNGLFLFSMLGVDTLQEIRTSWEKRDHEIHVPSFPDMHHVGDALLQAGFQDPVMDMEHLILEYPSVMHFLSDIKNSGAFLTHEMQQSSLDEKKYAPFLYPLEQRCKKEGSMSVTFEIIYGYALSKFAVLSETS